MTVKTAPHSHGTIMAGMSNVFIENTALTRSQYSTFRFTLIGNLLYNARAHTHTPVSDVFSGLDDVSSCFSGLSGLFGPAALN